MKKILLYFLTAFLITLGYSQTGSYSDLQVQRLRVVGNSPNSFIGSSNNASLRFNTGTTQRAYFDSSTGNFVALRGLYADTGGIKLYNNGGVRYFDALASLAIRLDGVNVFASTGAQTNVSSNGNVIVSPSGINGSDPFIFSQLGYQTRLTIGATQFDSVEKYSVIKGKDYDDGNFGKPFNLLLYPGKETSTGHVGDIFMAHNGTIPFGSVNIGTLTPDSSAILKVTSTSRGVMLPRMTTTQRNTITAKEALMVYNTTLHAYEYYNGSVWGSSVVVANSLGSQQFVARLGDTLRFTGDTTMTISFNSTTHEINFHSIGGGGGGGGGANNYLSAVAFANDTLYFSRSGLTPDLKQSIGGRYIPYTGATAAVNFGYNVLTTGSFIVQDTAGNGNIRLVGQTATPSAPAAGNLKVYANSSSRFTLMSSNGNPLSFSTARLTAARSVFLQDKDYTIADSAVVAANLAASVVNAYAISDTVLRLKHADSSNVDILFARPFVTLIGDITGRGKDTITTVVADTLKHSLVISGANLTTTGTVARLLGGFQTNNVSTSSNVYTTSSSGIMSINNTIHNYLSETAGEPGMNMRVGFSGQSSSVLDIGYTYAGTAFGENPFNTAASGKHPLASTVWISHIGNITSGGARVGVGANLYIDAKSTSSLIDSSYGLFCASTAFFSDTVFVKTLSSSYNGLGAVNGAMLQAALAGAAAPVDTTEKTLPTTGMTFSGTAPSGANTNTYSWQKSGKRVTLWMNIAYATPGSSLSEIMIPLPSDMPAPKVPNGFGSNGNAMYMGEGYLSVGMSPNGDRGRAYLEFLTGPAYRIRIVNQTAGAYDHAWVQISYKIP